MEENDYGTKSRSCIFRQVFLSDESGTNKGKTPPTDEAARVEAPGSGRKKWDQETEQPKTQSQVIVKSDGSRVLLVTTNFGGMQTTMSLEICKPTALQSNVPEEMQDIEGEMSQESV